jgi:WD40 repeat protein
MLAYMLLEHSRAIFVSDITMGALQHVLTLEADPNLEILTFASDNSTMASGYSCWDRSQRLIKIWDLRMSRFKAEKATFKVSPMRIDQLIFSPDVKSLIAMSSEGSEGRVTVWDLLSKTLRFEVPCAKIEYLTAGIALSPDGDFLALPRRKGVVEVWNTTTKKIAFSLPELANWVGRLSFSPDGLLLALALEDNTIRIWHMATRKFHCVFGGHADSITQIAFFWDSRILISASLDKTIKVWRVPASASMEDESDEVYNDSFSPGNYSDAEDELDKSGEVCNKFFSLGDESDEKDELDKSPEEWTARWSFADLAVSDYLEKSSADFFANGL